MLSEFVKSADWKSEKHVPIIECPDQVAKGEFFEVRVTLGKAIAHPNTTEHHIRWMELYFQPRKGQVLQLARFEFTAHGESAQGPNQGPAYTHPQGAASVKLGQPGTLHALAYCNIHGLWQSSKDVKVK